MSMTIHLYIYTYAYGVCPLYRYLKNVTGAKLKVFRPLPGLYESLKHETFVYISGCHNSPKHEISVCDGVALISHIDLIMSSQVALKPALTKISTYRCIPGSMGQRPFNFQASRTLGMACSHFSCFCHTSWYFL